MACAATPFFPLDEELNLAPGQLTPLLQEGLVRLGSHVPFRQAAALFGFFYQSYVCEATTRRSTYAAGRACEALQTQSVPAWGAARPPAKQLISVDGVMVPLVGGEWAEVKSMVLGKIDAAVREAGEWVVHSSELSYFARLADAATFTDLARAEVARRATSEARTVCAVSDGALWCQAFFDRHCPQAVRILDFPHAASYLAQASQAFYGSQTPAARTWFGTQRRRLKTGKVRAVLDALLELALTAYDQDAAAEVQNSLHESWSYLSKRQSMIAYAHFQQQGYPIASGAIESANKAVVQQRLKGPGMHWARASVNPMLALTTLSANQRWQEAWPAILTQRRRARQPARVRHAVPPGGEPTCELPTPKSPYRPPASHPWRKPFQPPQRPGPSLTQK